MKSSDIHLGSHSPPSFLRHGRFATHGSMDVPDSRHYQLIPLPGPQPSAESPAGPFKSPKDPIEQVVPISTRIFATKRGKGIYSWSRVSGRWGEIHQYEDDQFKIRAFESGHVCAYWVRPDGGCWEKFQILKLDLSNRLKQADIIAKCTVPPQVVSLALLSPERVVCAIRRRHHSGHKLSLWDPSRPFDTRDPVEPSVSKMLKYTEAPYRTATTLLIATPHLVPVNHQTFALWQPQPGDGKRISIHVLEFWNEQNPLDCSIVSLTFVSTLPSVQSILKFHKPRQELTVFGPNQLQTHYDPPPPPMSSPMKKSYWSECVLGSSIEFEGTCTHLAGQYLATSPDGIKLMRPIRPRHNGWETLLEEFGDLSVACLASEHELVTTNNFGTTLRLWQISSTGLRPTDGVNNMEDLPIVFNSVFERDHGRWKVNNQNLLIWTQEMLQHTPLPEGLQPEVSLNDDHFHRAREISDLTMELVSGREWPKLIPAKHDLLATMLHHFQADMQLALYTKAIQNPEFATAEFIQFLFLNTTHLAFMRYPYTLASAKFKRLQSLEKKKPLKGIVYAALEMAIGRHFDVKNTSDKEELQRFYWKMLASAKDTNLINEIDERILSGRLIDHRISEHPKIVAMEDQIKHLQRAVDTNRTNIANVARAVIHLKDAMVKQKKRQLVFGVAKLALTYFGGKLIDLIQGVVDLSDVMELADALLDSSPEIIRELASYGEEHVQEAIADEVLAILGAESPDQPLEDFATSRLQLLRANQIPAKLPARSHARPVARAGSGGGPSGIPAIRFGLPDLCAWYIDQGQAPLATTESRRSCQGARVYLSISKSTHLTTSEPGIGRDFKPTHELIGLKEFLRFSLKDTGSAVEISTRAPARIVITTQDKDETKVVKNLLEAAGIDIATHRRSPRPKHVPSKQASHRRKTGDK